MPKGRGWEWNISQEGLVRARRIVGWTGVIAAVGAVSTALLHWFGVASILGVAAVVARFVWGTLDLVTPSD